MPYIGNQPYQGVIDSGNIVDGSIQTGDLANSAVTTAKIADSNITTTKIADTGVTVAKLNSDVTQLIAQGGGPKITGVAITNSSWTVLDDTAVDTAGGYIKLTGTNFVTGCSVVVGTTSATAVTFTSSTELRVQLPAQAAGTYILYVTNPDGGTAIRVNAVTYSATPSWVTSSTLPQQDDGVAISIQLSATSATTYALQVGSTLPSGLTLTSGGLLSGTVSGLASDTSYSFTVVATDAELQDSPRAFTVNITASDTYFNLTTLLINGDTAPNVLTDASSNNFNLTAYGDARASNFTPYGTGWSNYFDGTGDYLSAAYNSAFDLGSLDFTIEAWIYTSDSSSNYPSIVGRWQGSGTACWDLRPRSIERGNFLTFVYSTNGTNAAFVDSNGPALSDNAWHHVVAVRSGNTFALFVDGTRRNTANFTGITIFNTASAPLYVGYDPWGTTSFTGYISNVRIVKNSAIYDSTLSTLTVPTTPLTAITNTLFLTCHANRIVDGSANNFAITRTGDVAVRSFNPFNITNTGTSGSAYFDGTGDYASLADNAAFNLSSDSFTIEAWVYPRSISTGVDLHIMAKYSAWVFWIDDATLKLGFDDNATLYLQSAANVIQLNTWSHVAIVRNTAVPLDALFVNGIQVASSSSLRSIPNNSNSVFISGNSSGWPIYISDLRLTKAAIYTTNFTPPAAPLTAVTNTQLLTLQNKQPHNNHGFQDSSTNSHLITRNGNTTQGTFSPFSPAGWSLSFTSGNGITVPTSIATSLASSGATFTIEAWVYLNSYGSAPTNQEYYNRAIFGIGNTYGAFLIDSTGKLNLYSYDGTGRFTTSTGTVALRTWTHVAASVTGGVIKLFIDGTLSGTGTWYGHIGGAITTCIGSTSDTNAGTNRHFDGYIASFRLSNIARYNISFNKPTSLYTTDANTVILTGQLNRLVDESNSPQTLTNVSASIQAYSPFKPTAAYSPTTHGGSAYFDGSDTLTFSREAVNNLSTTNFTWECWVYRTAVNDTTYADAICCSVTNYTGLAAGIDPAGKVGYAIGNTAAGNNWNIRLGVDPGNPKGSITVPLNSWTHIALVRNGSQFVGFVNGAVDQSFTSADAIGNIGSDYYIGRWHDSYNRFWLGYISNIRLIRGINLYSTASTTNGTQVFSPPTTPFTSTKETSYLFNFTDAAARDSSGRLVLETVNDSKVSTVQKKYGTGAMYFDGTGDGIVCPSPTLFNFGSGDLTIECWFNYNSGTTNYGLFTTRLNAGQYAPVQIQLEAGNVLKAYASTSGSSWAVNITSSTSPVAGTWYHVALVRSGTTFTLYLNGYNVGTATGISGALATSTLYGGVIGVQSADLTNPMNGYIDDLRVTRYARYTGTSTSTPNFTPPAQTFKLR